MPLIFWKAYSMYMFAQILKRFACGSNSFSMYSNHLKLEVPFKFQKGFMNPAFQPGCIPAIMLSSSWPGHTCVLLHFGQSSEAGFLYRHAFIQLSGLYSCSLLLWLIWTGCILVPSCIHQWNQAVILPCHVSVSEKYQQHASWIVLLERDLDVTYTEYSNHLTFKFLLSCKKVSFHVSDQVMLHYCRVVTARSLLKAPETWWVHLVCL